MNEGLPKLDVSRKSGEESIHQGGDALNVKLLDFWRWSASDLFSNATRGVLARYLVARALGLHNGVRVEWDAYDLLLASGTRIEVKSAAYLQSWLQAKPSRISFSIRPTQSLASGTNDLRRQGDVYVFCLLHHQDKATLDPLDLEQWHFYIVSAKVLNEKFPIQKTLGLQALLELHPIRARFEDIAACIERMSL